MTIRILPGQSSWILEHSVHVFHPQPLSPVFLSQEKSIKWLRLLQRLTLTFLSSESGMHFLPSLITLASILENDPLALLDNLCCPIRRDRFVYKRIHTKIFQTCFGFGWGGCHFSFLKFLHVKKNLCWAILHCFNVWNSKEIQRQKTLYFMSDKEETT